MERVSLFIQSLKMRTTLGWNVRNLSGFVALQLEEGVMNKVERKVVSASVSSIQTLRDEKN